MTSSSATPAHDYERPGLAPELERALRRVPGSEALHWAMAAVLTAMVSVPALLAPAGATVLLLLLLLLREMARQDRSTPELRTFAPGELCAALTVLRMRQRRRERQAAWTAPLALLVLVTFALRAGHVDGIDPNLVALTAAVPLAMAAATAPMARFSDQRRAVTEAMHGRG